MRTPDLWMLTDAVMTVVPSELKATLYKGENSSVLIAVFAVITGCPSSTSNRRRLRYVLVFSQEPVF